MPVYLALTRDPVGPYLHRIRALDGSHTCIRWQPHCRKPDPLCIYGIRQHTSAYVSIRQHTCIRGQPPTAVNPIRYVYLAYVSIRQHTSAYVSIRRHTCIRGQPPTAVNPIRYVYLAYVSIRQHTSAYVGIRQHMSAYVHTRAAPLP
jgi:hypothetical protein